MRRILGALLVLVAVSFGQTVGPGGGGGGSSAKITLPFVTPENSGAKGDGGFYYDGSITPPSMPANSATGTSTTPTTLTITTPSANSLAIYAGLGNASWSASMTGTNQVNQTFSVGNYALNVSTQAVASVGSTSGTGTLATSQSWVASAVALGPAAGSTIAQVGTWTNVQTASTTTVTVTTPSGVTAGDVLVAVIAWYSHAITAPAGWTQLTTATDGGGDIQAVYYYVAGASTPASFTWTQTGSSGMAGAMGAYRGVKTVSTLTSATAGFSAASVNDAICTAGTGASGVQQCGTIKAYNSATSVDVSYIAAASASNIWFAYGTDDTAAFTTMLGSAPCSTVGCRVQLQPHMYMLTSALTLPADRTIQFLGAGYGLGNTENSYLNGNTAPDANMGTRLDFATVSLGGPAITLNGTAGVTSTAAFDLFSDLAIYGGAGKGRDGGGGAGIYVGNWQGLEITRTAVVNFSGAGVYVDGVTSSSYKDYSEQVYLDGYYGLWNGGAGFQLGSTGLFINNIETTAINNSVLENNGGPGIYLAGKAIQGFTAFNDVIQWNNVAASNPELEINYATGADAPQACLVESNYFEVDTNGGSKSSAWVTPNATGCVMLNNFLAGDAQTGRTGLNTTSPLTAFHVNGSAAVGFDNTSANSYDVLEKATVALTADELVCLDSANADSVVACGTSTTAQMIGFADGAISAGEIGPVRIAGKANPTSTTTCAIGNYVTASSTTAGDVACTATLPAQGALVGFAETALGTAPGAITVLIDKR